MTRKSSAIKDEFLFFISEKKFPCVAARDAVKKNTVAVFEASHLACPADDMAILNFLYTFTADFRKGTAGFQSAAIIFSHPMNIDEDLFESMMWKRLQALSDLDKKNFNHDTRVSNDPMSDSFSYSINGEAFFVLAMHPASSRKARRFHYPVLIFNPHQQFVQMKKTKAYDNMKAIVRKRDLLYSGSANPMLTDFGERSETFQYSGKAYDADWKCPLQLKDPK